MTETNSDMASRKGLENVDGVNAMNQGDYESAIEYFTKAIDREPNKSAIWFNRARSYEELGKYEEAISDFKKAITINNFKDGKIPNCYLGLGNCYGALKEYQLSLENYIIAQEMDISNEIVIYNIIYIAGILSDSTTACKYSSQIDIEKANPQYLETVDSIIKNCRSRH